MHPLLGDAAPNDRVPIIDHYCPVKSGMMFVNLNVFKA